MTGVPLRERLGFMQGRLSPILNGRIQCFPWGHWEQEIVVAGADGWRLMEWTLDDDRLLENPYLTTTGQQAIRDHCAAHGVRIPSVTGDCFMQAPFFRASGAERGRRLDSLRKVIDASAKLEVDVVVFPIVDGGRLETAEDRDDLLSVMSDFVADLRGLGLRIAFESDLGPQELRDLMELLDPRAFGVNYDSGNSASMGYDLGEEIEAYGHRIMNVHLKDRAVGGGTVPLAKGDVDFARVFRLLADRGYEGNFVLQGARAEDGDHRGLLLRYRDSAKGWYEEAME